jgi:hypothetical protein
MNDIRLAWEPSNLTPLTQVEERFAAYIKGKKGVTLLGNGTLLFIVEALDCEEDARLAMAEAKYLTDFKVVELKEGGYLVGFNEAVAVFVSAEEFGLVREEVSTRMADLKFPEEEFLGMANWPKEHVIVGLYARGKLQRDVNNFAFYKRIRG